MTIDIEPRWGLMVQSEYVRGEGSWHWVERASDCRVSEATLERAKEALGIDGAIRKDKARRDMRRIVEWLDENVKG